jgi:hypothetical protein
MGEPVAKKSIVGLAGMIKKVRDQERELLGNSESGILEKQDL